MEPLKIFIASEESADLVDRIERIVRRLIREEVALAVERGMMKPYLTKRELQDWTGWSDRQVAYKKSRREIPYIKRGRLVLFPTREIIAYLEEGRVPVRRTRTRKPGRAGKVKASRPVQHDES